MNYTSKVSGNLVNIDLILSNITHLGEQHGIQ